MTTRTILITGASSGIGRALAIGYAQAGIILHLGGRDSSRLAAVAGECRARGAVVSTRLVDVRDATATAEWLGAADRLDLVIANAGIGAGVEAGEPESAAQVRTIFAANLDGALNTALPALDIMRRQTPGTDGVRGRIATVASIAAFIPAPGAPSYCATKAALDTWTVATAISARAVGVRMTSVCPGYIRTPMTAKNRFPMPGLMDADRAARIISRGIAAGKVRVTFPWWLGAGARIGGLLPAGLIGAVLSLPPGKAALPSETP